MVIQIQLLTLTIWIYLPTNLIFNNFTIATFREIPQVVNALSQTYGGDLMIHAAFANTKYKFKKLTAVLGQEGKILLKSSLEHTIRRH
jgi:subtilase family serine protease